MTTEPQDFDAAFARLMQEDGLAETAPPAVETVPPAVETVPPEGEQASKGEQAAAEEQASEGEQAATERQASESEQASEGEQAPDDKVVAPPAGTDKGDDSDDGLSDEALLSRFAQMIRKADAAEAKVASADKPEETPSIYTPEELAIIEAYRKDWSDVATAESLIRRAEYRAIVAHVFDEIAKHLRPISETVELLSMRTHLADLQNKIQDYDAIRDSVVQWVETQPSYLQAAYKHVIENGTVEEVADLIDRYKRETGASMQASKGQTPPLKKEPELPPATKQAAAALAPVGSKRPAVTTAATAVDFDTAFARFAGTS